MANSQPIWSTVEGQAVLTLATVAVASASLLLILLLHRQGWTLSHKRRIRLPPTPWTWIPVLGQLRLLGKVVFSACSIRQRLGPIFTLRIGRVPVVFVTSASLAHEALVEKGTLFADRATFPSRAIFTSNFRNINAAPYGPHWRALRRNLVQEMISPAKIKAFKPGRENILHRMIQRIRNEAQSNDGVVQFYLNCRTAMFELLLFMCFGYHFQDEKVQQISAFIEEILPHQRGTLQDFFPFLRFVNPKVHQKLISLRKRQIDMLNIYIQEHQKLSELGKVTYGSYLETLLRIQDNPITKLSNSDIVSLCSEFLVAGTDTTVTTLEWTMAHLVKDPHIQTKLYEQIKEVVGNRLVEEDDLVNLTYLKSVITETLRIHPPGHFVLPHKVSQPCKLGGFDITPDAVVNFDIVSISRNPDIWDEPLEFRPERMFGADVDITGTRKVTMIPFGAGRRICAGLGLASVHMELFVARLIQAFHWTTTQPGEIVDFSEKHVFTVLMKYPLKARIEERS